ncbi:MAG: hypothetical protein R3E95_10010 [Thiolinea sp.]
MNDTANNAYTFGTATLEIIVLIAGAFILGALLCYLLRLLGLCCRRRKSPAAAETLQDRQSGEADFAAHCCCLPQPARCSLGGPHFALEWRTAPMKRTSTA